MSEVVESEEGQTAALAVVGSVYVCVRVFVCVCLCGSGVKRKQTCRAVAEPESAVN